MDLPLGPVTSAVVPLALRSTVRDDVLPLGPVVLDDTLPFSGDTWRVTLCPSGPLMVVLRLRASARVLGDSSETETSVMATTMPVDRWIYFMIDSFSEG